MKHSPRTFLLLIVSAALALTSVTTALATDILVVDPVSGETMPLADIDVASLSDEDRRSIGDQLAEQGVNPRQGGESRGERPRD